MSKLLTIALIIACAAPVRAQITVTNNLQPAPGTMLQSYIDGLADSAHYTSVTAGSGGPMIWDFSSRVYGQAFTSTVVSPASTPHIDSFPAANVVLQTSVGNDTTWSVHRSGSDVFYRQGTVTRGGGIGLYINVYRNVEPEWQFPIQHGDQWTGYRHWTQQNPPLHTDIFDTTVCTADAWGTVRRGSRSLPCLRVITHERFTYQTYDSNNVPILSYSTNMYTANFIGAGFVTLATVSKFVSDFATSYSASASGELINVTAIDDGGAMPREFTLAQNYPNPFNPATTIEYVLPAASDVTLDVFDLLGRRIGRLVDGNRPAGHHRVTWDATGARSGVYFYRITAGDYAETKRMTLIK